MNPNDDNPDAPLALIWVGLEVRDTHAPFYHWLAAGIVDTAPVRTWRFVRTENERTIDVPLTEVWGRFRPVEEAQP